VLYNNLLSTVRAQLVRTRFDLFYGGINSARRITPDKQAEMVETIVKKHGLSKKLAEVTLQANKSVRDWVSNKAWRLRNHFLKLGIEYFMIRWAYL
jgi:hypothetical protein